MFSVLVHRYASVELACTIDLGWDVQPYVGADNTCFGCSYGELAREAILRWMSKVSSYL